MGSESAYGEHIIYTKVRGVERPPSSAQTHRVGRTIIKTPLFHKGVFYL